MKAKNKENRKGTSYKDKKKYYINKSSKRGV
jgi:hypothetical protein